MRRALLIALLAALVAAAAAGGAKRVDVVVGGQSGTLRGPNSVTL